MLTNNYGFITDYLAEAFHYLFQHTNRYEEVTKRIRLGAAVEGRDEKGIKKIMAAFLKILHPAGSPTDEEFEEYVFYAVECRRRVKEQMNKRKPDEEFARINLSYFRANRKEITVFCPESKNAPATQEPMRRVLNEDTKPKRLKGSRKSVPYSITDNQPSTLKEDKLIEQIAWPQEQHFTIHYGDMGYSYDSIFGPYLQGAKSCHQSHYSQAD